MAILTRTELLNRFVNGCVPSQKDFQYLIESTLNRRDDNFFGKWEPGMKYCLGDVVIHNKTLYLLFNTGSSENCPPENNPFSNSSNGNNPSDQLDTEGCICSVTPPNEEPTVWCPLELIVDDQDWAKEENQDGEIITVYNLNANIGIGTDQPTSRLEVTDNLYGSIQLEPNTTASPRLSLLRLPGVEGVKQPAHQLDLQLDQEAKLTTDSTGFAFYKTQPIAPEDKAQMGKTPSPGAENTMEESPALLFMTTSDENLPNVGVGTKQPAGILHTLQSERGELVVNPGNANEPGLLLINCEPASDNHYLLSGITQNHAYFQSSNDGFRFKKGDDLSVILKQDNLDSGSSLLTIKGDGKVGVGTDDPKSQLEVNEPNFGSIRLDLSNDNPAVSTINSRPMAGFPITYHAFGVNDEAASFITNANGFVFKKGGPYGSYNNEVNIDHGDKIVFIGESGKVGIQTTYAPEEYDLEVNGDCKLLSLYFETNNDNIEVRGDLSGDKVLEQLEKINPIKYLWKPHVNAKNPDEPDTYFSGLPVQTVSEYFPGATRKFKGKKSISYAGITAILVQAIKDLNTEIKDLKLQIEDLNNSTK